MILATLKTMFGTPRAEALALRELEEARRSLLTSQSAADYAVSMSNYHQDRILRLTEYLKESARSEQTTVMSTATYAKEPQ
jgi:hypothetical protein